MSRMLFICLWACGSGETSETPSAACASQYVKSEASWKSMSGANTLYIPVDHRPNWYWQEVSKRRGGLEPVSGYEDLWLDRLFAEAQIQILGCSVHGGRYWEVVLDLPRLFQIIRRAARPIFLRLLSRLLVRTDDELNSMDDLPDVMRLSVCAPQVCDQDLMVDIIVPQFYAPMLMGAKPERKLLNRSFQDVVRVEELLDWSSINIDFAIGGTDGCGTSSLHRNLEQHPELAFSTVGEDFFFTAELAHRLLPLKSQVESYNTQLEEIKDTKLKSVGFRPKIMGICNPALFSTGLARRKLAGMPNLKMIVILCDPLGRLEKNFMEYHYCFDSLAEAKLRGLASGARDDEACFASAGSLLSERFGKLKRFWQRREVAVHMPTLMNLFTGRIIVVHQEQLRIRPNAVFSSLASFLGARYTFRSQTSFHRYNSVGGHRTDLCHNATLVSALKRHLEPEYQMQELLMKDAQELVPESLLLRSTRCDRIATEEATYCPSRSACE